MEQTKCGKKELLGGKTYAKQGEKEQVLTTMNAAEGST